MLKESQQMLQTGGKKCSRPAKGVFDPGLGKKGFKKPSLNFSLTSGSGNLNIDEI